MTAGRGLADSVGLYRPVPRQEGAVDLRAEPSAASGATGTEPTGTEPATVSVVADSIALTGGAAPVGAATTPTGVMTATAVIGSMVVIDALNRASAAARHHVENVVLRGADLSWSGYAVLALACEERSVETRVVAAAVGVSRGTLTGVVRTLEGKNLIRRVPHSRDGRLVLLEPTTTGRRLARRLAPRVEAAQDIAIGCLSGTERQELADLLGRLVADLQL